MLFLLGLPMQPFAQEIQQWPRNDLTGRVEFSGVLPWPIAAPSLEQQQALVRQWYTTKLSPPKPGKFAMRTTALTTFAGLPNQAYFDSLTYEPTSTGAVDSVYDWNIWRLIYQVHLTPTPHGLAYRLSEFRAVAMVYDTGSEARLEEALRLFPKEMAVFHRRVRRALAGW
ncbi:hypothetical protein [Hymenobacter wooponensis]|uniref:DUF4468 domain-containing protein n=1 Tax=Hymenobacter wooponensis TaxID=1525360 RepID=A0A4Z0MUG1_9BACT|nr:hypothetical protein [Hymenobacter wooponensis]TGD83100.1 hypothetical protein EU557_04790 [Hymenobacter wooponensis]